MQCRICAAAPAETFTAREMMFGDRDAFEYFVCSACGCVQIAEIPSAAELARHYRPDQYYSRGVAAGRVAATWQWTMPLARMLGISPVAALRFYRPDLTDGDLVRLVVAASKLYLQRDGVDGSSVLDVGCGSGSFAYAVAKAGATRVLGIDPFLGDTPELDGVALERASIHDLDEDGAWDLITFHHSFEHIGDPAETLESVARLLKPGGRCLLRMPDAGSNIFKHYKRDWALLDAPRHLIIHTQSSLRIVAESAGLTLDAVVGDSTSFSYWGSE